MAIPAWTPAGLLPPIRPGQPGHSRLRSPYPSTLGEVLLRFGTSPARLKILQGFLNHRSALHQIGVVQGFQWLDGSFMEDVELLEARPPNDMDVVTFYELPPGQTQSSLLTPEHLPLFDTQSTKTQFKVDAYFHALGSALSTADVRQISYWYSMWSHRRDFRWKGFVQVDLSPADDPHAKLVLGQLLAEASAA